MPAKVYPLDLNFLDHPNTIAAYVIPHQDGAALVETGPESTVETLIVNLAHYGLTPKDITDVFLTHIHLDHAGAAGWMARQGARIHVHPVGVPHLINPEKLISSAKRIYGDRLNDLWGQFQAVPEQNLIGVEDGGTITFGNMQITALHTPGHAEHHIAWVFDDVCFTGDVGGVRIPGSLYVRMPVVPPELNFEKWYASLERLHKLNIQRIAPTHYGFIEDVQIHFDLALTILEGIEKWMVTIMPTDPPIELLRDQFIAYSSEQALQIGLDKDLLNLYEIANPAWMGADGISRYWRKFRVAYRM